MQISQALIFTKQVHILREAMNSLRDSSDGLNIPWGFINVQMLFVMQLQPKFGVGALFNGAIHWWKLSG